MHPKIEKLYELIKDIYPEKIFNVEILHFLKENGASRTETTITLHLGFKVDIEKADDFVIKSQIWDPEDPNDVFYQTLKYMYYNPDDPNYEADDDRVQVSF